ncbi:MAG: hypothetical protein F6K40_08660 [Okeania sp. SIO3I5]|uniref:hypothetical protein n=1 Tax=Okeania sp. SIO3I5 TaxID=2607805 RepID=UPI0013BE4E6F|nr:hypothetical protein [Okeania sp. SIO3I5]NEQ36347.1 hypothetical protein [Okeania sp. SIO3I5]
MINPYGVTNSPKIKGLNSSKPATVNNTRLYKAVDITRHNAKTILLGASRIETGINPNSSLLKAYQPVYNLGIPAASLYEQRRYLEYAVAYQPELELVILGIDLWLMANPRKTRQGFSEARLKSKGLSLREFLDINFSIDTLTKSIETISSNNYRVKYNYYGENGLRNTEYLSNIKFTHWLGNPLNRKEYKINEFALENLKLIKEICQKNSIELVVFITPPHASHIEAVHIGGFGHVIPEMKREIVKIMPVWDFYSYNSVTTEPLDTVTNYRDSSHMKTEVGDLILSRIFGDREQTVPSDFGVMITPDNIESELTKMSDIRKSWLGEQPETVKFLHDLKQGKTSL